MFLVRGLTVGEDENRAEVLRVTFLILGEEGGQIRRRSVQRGALGGRGQLSVEAVHVRGHGGGVTRERHVRVDRRVPGEDREARSRQSVHDERDVVAHAVNARLGTIPVFCGHGPRAVDDEVDLEGRRDFEGLARDRRTGTHDDDGDNDERASDDVHDALARGALGGQGQDTDNGPAEGGARAVGFHELARGIELFLLLGFDLSDDVIDRGGGRGIVEVATGGLDLVLQLDALVLERVRGTRIENRDGHALALSEFDGFGEVVDALAEHLVVGR